MGDNKEKKKEERETKKRKVKKKVKKRKKKAETESPVPATNSILSKWKSNEKTRNVILIGEIIFISLNNFYAPKRRQLTLFFV